MTTIPRPPRHCVRPLSTRGFTLVELLTVMAIMTVAVAIVAGAIRFSASPALVSGGNKVASLASYARQNAVSRNALTALLLLGNQGTDADYRAFTVLEYKGDTGWQQISPWEYLPTGIVVDSSDSESCSFLTNSPNPFPFLGNSPLNPPVLFNNKPITGQGAYAARIFLPNGALQNSEAPATIRLVQGKAQNGTLTHTHRGDDGKPASIFDISIIGASGAVKISRD